MNNTDVIEDNAEISHSVSIVFTTVTGICFVLNVTYIIVCFKALKKTLHHLLILTLLFSDAILSASASLLCLIPMVQSLKNNTAVCVFQLFIILYGLLLNYMTLFLLCIQRYVLIRTYSFGTALKRIENKKTPIVLGTIVVTFLYQLLNSLLVPQEQTIKGCSALNLYGRNLSLFVGLGLVPLTILMVSLVFFYLLGSYRVWQTFFKTTVQPIDIGTKDNQNIAHGKPCPWEAGGSNNDESKWCESVRPTHFDLDEMFTRRSKSYDASFPSRPNDNSVNPSNETFDEINDEIIELDENLIVLDFHISSKNPESPKATIKPMEVEIIDNNVDLSKKETTGEIISKEINNKQTKQVDKYELRLFVTCVILAVQTMVLTLPLLLGFWNDVVSSTPFKLQTQLILGIPYLFNSISNPFLYAWRITEIRQEFKKLFKK